MGGDEAADLPSLRGPRARKAWRVLVPCLLVAGPIAAGIGGAFATAVTGVTKVVMVILIVVGAGVPAIIAAISERRRRRQLVQLEAESIGASTRLAMAASIGLASIVECLTEVAEADEEVDRRRLLTRFEQTVVNVASNICGVDGAQVRAVYFKADAAQCLMTCEAHYGGIHPSPRRFLNDRTDLAGVGAWTWARTGNAKLWEDIRKDAPPGFEPAPTTRYQTFITVGVVRDDTVYGMLNIDAPKTGQLGEVDAMLLTLLATSLALGNTLARA